MLAAKFLVVLPDANEPSHHDGAHADDADGDDPLGPEQAEVSGVRSSCIT